MTHQLDNDHAILATFTQLTVAMSAEKNIQKLLKMILSNAMKLAHTDAGTLYILNEEGNQLIFEIFANQTLKILPAHISEVNLAVTNINLYTDDNQPNYKNVVSYCYHHNKKVVVEDAYHAEGFDFTGLHAADKKFDYQSLSILAIPLLDHQQKIVGVLQLINAMDEDQNIVPFSKADIALVESLASLAAIALTKQALIEAQKKLFESLISLVAKAIDEKSKHTSKHCERVPIITNMIVAALNKTKAGALAKVHLDQDQTEALSVAAWLHDCGKLTTPEYVVNKSTKLETIYDRIEVIIARILIIERDLKIDYLQSLLDAGELEQDNLFNAYQTQIETLKKDRAFLVKINKGGEFLRAKDLQKLNHLATHYHYQDAERSLPLLTQKELSDLSISRGTLNDEEREIIKNHVSVTYRMLSSLPFPDQLKEVPEIAGSHHERIDGHGYPRGLKKDQILIQARILAIADIFEALTSADRPYKQAKKLSEVLAIMQKMADTGHIDSDLFQIFLAEKVYLKYAQSYLQSEQLDV